MLRELVVFIKNYGFAKLLTIKLNCLRPNFWFLDSEITRFMNFESDQSFPGGGRRHNNLKGSPDQTHFIFEIIVGKRQIRHKNRWNMTSFKFRVVLCRIRLFPTLISEKKKWLESGLP